MNQPIRLNYRARPYFRTFHQRHQRFAFLVAHRRAGKSYCLLGDLVVRALHNKTPSPQYAYIAPMLSQARNIAWKALKIILGDLIDHCKISETRLSITLPNRAEIRLFGLDNPDALRGLYFNGVVLDEAQDCPIEVITTVIIPAITDKRGFLTFSGTPKGTANTFYQYRELAKSNSNEWFYEELPVSKTKIISEADLLEAKAQMSDEDYEQEFECNWLSGNMGAIFDRYLSNSPVEVFEHDPKIKVNLVFDIGFSDATAVWFYQLRDGRCDVLNYYECQQKSISTVVSECMEIAKHFNFSVGHIHLPHDSYNRTAQTGKSIVERLWAEGYYNIKKIPDVSVKSGISNARDFFKNCRFHERCHLGLEALKEYKYQYNHKLKSFSKTPAHDWSSHGADSFRYLSLCVDDNDLLMSKRTALSSLPSVLPPEEYMRSRPDLYSTEHIQFFYDRDDEDSFL